MADPIKATISGLQKFENGQTVEVVTSQHRSQFVSQVEPEYMELARAGKLYSCENGTAVGLANVAAIPTTTASYALYNGSASKHLVVLRIATSCEVITAPVTFMLIAGISPLPQASAETEYASSLSKAMLPRSPAPEGYLTDAVTLADTPVWNTLGSYEGNSGLLGAAIVADVKGMFIVPPSFALGIDIVGSAGTTPLFFVNVIWAELELQLF